MKNIKMKIRHLSEIQIAFILIFVGLFFGILFANIFRNNYSEQISQYQNSIFYNIATSDINYGGLFRYILIKNYKEFIIFWLLCITILGIPYMGYKIISYGFTIGFLVSTITMQYGFKGILLILVYGFPHGLLYIPIILISLYKGYLLCLTIYHDKKSFSNGLANLIKSHLMLLFILALAIFLASFIEAFVGSFLLKKTLGLFT